MHFVRQQIKELTSSNIVELYNAWSSTTTYSLELDNDNLTNASMVYYNGFYYRSLTNNNLNKNPEETENVYWFKHSISNKNAMFDLSAQTKSIMYNDDLVVVFPQNNITTLGLGYYTASQVIIEVLDDDLETVLSTIDTGNHINDNVTDYWTYIYEDYNEFVELATKVSINTIGAYIRVTFKESVDANYASCGFLVGGDAVFMGNTLWGVNFSFNSFAIKDYDSLGALTITKGAVQDLVDCECDIETSGVMELRRNIKRVYNDIVMFILDERDDSNYENLITLGVIQDASVVLQNAVLSTISYSIMEAI